MKNFMFIFLISVINPSSRNAEDSDYGLDCYQTASYNQCLKDNAGLAEGIRPQKTFECLKDLKEEVRNCDPPLVCTKATLTFEDNTKIILSGCEDFKTREKCGEFKNEAIVLSTGKKLKFPVNCTPCKEKLCNGKTKKIETSSVLPVSPETKPSETKQNRSSEILPSFAVLFFVVSFAFMF